MKWKDIDNMKTGTGGGLFISLKDGDSVEGAFVEGIETVYSSFEEKKTYAEPGEGRSARFRSNFIISENGEYKAKIFECGITVVKQCRAYINEYGLDTIFKIQRSGSGKDDTVYTLMYKDKIDAGQKKLFDSVELNDLKVKDSATKNEPTTDDIPF